MKYVLKIVGLAGGIEGPCTGSPVGHFVKSYDPEAHDGRGDTVGTLDLTEAQTFDSPDEAIVYYRQISKTRPLRPDGRPNRPLTAFTVEVLPVPDDDEIVDRLVSRRLAKARTKPMTRKVH